MCLMLALKVGSRHALRADEVAIEEVSGAPAVFGPDRGPHALGPPDALQPERSHGVVDRPGRGCQTDTAHESGHPARPTWAPRASSCAHLHGRPSRPGPDLIGDLRVAHRADRDGPTDPSPLTICPCSSRGRMSSDVIAVRKLAPQVPDAETSNGCGPRFWLSCAATAEKDRYWSQAPQSPACWSCAVVRASW